MKVDYVCKNRVGVLRILWCEGVDGMSSLVYLVVLERGCLIVMNKGNDISILICAYLCVKKIGKSSLGLKNKVNELIHPCK